ncbi:MAG: prepilin-type N-terminal cleavage/methylation domain-containing protein [Vulcanimicrobiota bacterium]
MRPRGFTLIELMICIAILAILAAIQPLTWHLLGSLAREKDYRFAAQTCEQTRQSLLKADFNMVAPRLLRVGADGWIDLGQVVVVEGSLRLFWPDGTPAGSPLERRGSRLRLPAEWRGRQLVVDYQWLADYLPEQGEAHTVDARGQVQLYNQPVEAVDRVLLAQADQLSPVAYQLGQDGKLQLDQKHRGQVVVVDYRGGRIRTEVEGRYLDDTLEPQLAPSDFKQIRLVTTYGGERQVELGFLKVKP